MRGLFLLFLVVPIVEMLVLIEVGSRIGAWYTVGLVLLTAVLGINILKHQGFSTLSRAQLRMQQGEMPAQELVEGFMLAIGGALLLTPGFVTDAIGFALLIPPTRKALAARLLRSNQFQTWGTGASGFSFSSFSTRRPPGAGSAGNSDFFEGEFSREQPARKPLDAPPDNYGEDEPKK